MCVCMNSDLRVFIIDHVTTEHVTFGHRGYLCNGYSGGCYATYYYVTILSLQGSSGM